MGVTLNTPVVRHPEHPLRAGVYARIRYEDALDLPKQGQARQAFAKQKGWTIALIEHEMAAEPTIRLNARDRVIKAAQAGDLDVIVAWKLDRIARSLPALVSLLEILDASNVSLATLADDFDFTSERGPELMRIMWADPAWLRGCCPKLRIWLPRGSASGRSPGGLASIPRPSRGCSDSTAADKPTLYAALARHRLMSLKPMTSRAAPATAEAT